MNYTISDKLKGMPIPNVINLKECVDRKEYTLTEFKKLGVDKVNIHSYDRYNENSIPFTGDPELINVIAKGVTSSHLLTIKHWYENTDEEYGIFFEDDVDFSTVQHWNFTLEEFIERCGSKWGALHLCNVFEYPYNPNEEYAGLVAMVPRQRQIFDHGLQCYVLKRWYAKKIIDYYFDDWQIEGSIHIRMPLGSPPAFENNLLHGFGLVVSFPLFNQNIIDFRSKNIYFYNQQAQSAIYSYEFTRDWWQEKGSSMSLEDIFNNYKPENFIKHRININ